MDSGAAAQDVITAFYDRHPYPPPPANLDAYRDRWLQPGMSQAEYHLLFPSLPFRGQLDILIAGCGTSQAARHALRWPEARVVGIDVGEASLQQTAALGQRYHLDNLELHQLPIEQIDELEGSFDLIVCTGVLHHLKDPDQGLRALRSALRPGGAMHLMVYARYGRQGVSMMQEYGRQLGIGTTAREVLDFANTLAEIPRDHPLAPALRDSADFQHADALADALLNPRERSYSVPELFALLKRGGLAFGRWHRQAPYLPQCGAPATTPHAGRLQSMPTPEQFAAVELFRGSMKRHSLLAYRDDDPPEAGYRGLPDDQWADVVPFRRPDTVLIDERLPPEAAGVLINQSHTYSDLILPLTRSERHMFEMIDGHRTVGETAGDRNGGEAHDLYQRLFWYDQVVFGSGG